LLGGFTGTEHKIELHPFSSTNYSGSHFLQKELNMKELFEQTTQMMEKSWNLWKQSFSGSPWAQDADATFLGKWSSWIAAMRSTCDANMGTWKTFVEQSEETFFKTFKQTPFYTEALESQWRELWSGLKKAQNLQQDIIKGQLEKMEELLKKNE
jgi:hypothetical protein